MKEITIGFSTGKSSFTSSLIRAAEDTPYSHVYMKFRSNSLDRNLYYHADLYSVHFNNEATFLKENKVIEEYTFRVEDEVFYEILQLCYDEVGKAYGWKQIFGMATVRLMYLWFNKKINNPFRDGDASWVCSEIAAKILMTSGRQLDLARIEWDGPKWVHSEMLSMVNEGAAKISYVNPNQ